MSNSLIADAVARIRNAQSARLREVVIYYSRLLVDVASLLEDEGYISSYEVFEIRPSVKRIVLRLKYYANAPVINKIKLFSRPGKRMYSSAKNIPKFYGGLGITVLSTSKGVLPSYKAMSFNCGGELLFGVY
ncbi:ribosomal S8 family protein [Neorickettsia helminthoeca str. Oregon]|uniref:Small ribosomal subunit protein uS8 n=1 Tax=Neorickettsia helminthoeca str. Oregon TaxID=1286528 RepID=X5H3E9_9RICK|nr:30S ribosomal protein S8 [Neorickettsia helminthoeca]AHX11223.1 ribosomal S8 family protein [Neorickettsia helminthoeca str. Oregon]